VVGFQPGVTFGALAAGPLSYVTENETGTNRCG